MTWRLLGLCAALVGGLVAAGPPRPGVPVPARTPGPPEYAGLHNVHRLSPRLISGSSPEGAAGFASLRRLGVRTVLSVDGATPDADLAARYGLRYVHLPVGYDGIPPPTLARITKAVRDLPGPVYLHCHHGKHRGPAAAAGVLVCLGELTPTDAAGFLTHAGTDPRYRGLITLPATARPLTPADLDRVPADFPARAATADLTQLMVRIDETWDRLKAGRDARYEAVQLQELYREAARLPQVTTRGEAFARLFADAEAAAKQLEGTPGRPESIAASQKLCTQCHAKYRD